MAETNIEFDNQGQNSVLSLKSLYDVIKRRFWIIVVVALVFCGAAVGLSVLQTPRYEASVTLLVGQGQGITKSPNDALGLQQITQTMATMADSQRIYGPIIKKFHLNLSPQEFANRLSVQQVSATQLVQITYTDTDPQTARQVANALGQEFSDQIDQVSDNSGQITASVWTTADTPTQPVSPKPLRNGVLALLLGGVIGLGIAFLLEMFDDSWSSPEEAEQISGVPTFGIIPEFSSVASSKRPYAPARRKRQDERERQWVEENYVKADKKEEETDQAGRLSVVNWPMAALLVGEDGKIKESNRALQRMTGFSEREIVGSKLAKFASHPDDVEENARLQNELAAGQREDYRIEKRLVKKNGELIWARLDLSRVAENGGPFAGAVQDITELKHVEEEMRLSAQAGSLSDERLRAVLEVSPLSMYSFTPDGYPLVGGERWASFWHSGEGEAEGARSNTSIFEDERLRVSGLTGYVEKSIAAAESVTTPPLNIEGPGDSGELNGNGSGEGRWVRAGIHPLLDDGGRVYEVVITLEDVTAETRAEQNLKLSESRQKELQEAREKAEKELQSVKGKFQSLVQLVTEIREDRDS